MIVYGWPYVVPPWHRDLAAWLRLCGKCWLAFVLVVGFSAASYLGLFLAVRAVV